jgi:hypothetical protein
MNTETIFFTLFIIWNFNHFVPQNLIFLFHILYNKCRIYTDILEEHLFKDLYKQLFENKDVDENEIKDLDIVKPEIKYEDKYLIEFRKLDKEFIFTDIEEELKAQKYIDFYEKINKSYTDKLDIIKKEIRKTEIKLTKYEENDDYCICDDDDDSNISRTKEETIKFLVDEKCKLQLDFDKLNEDEVTIVKQSEEMAKKFIIDQRLDKLKNCFIIENTPLGNVLMIFDKDLETFKYYSDNTIPYRYLETVGRKYAKQFCCRPIFVDMEEELKTSEIKWEKERNEKEEDKIKKEEAIKNNITIPEKKSVFTKFKSYNKDAGTGHVNIGAPPKTSISNKYLTEKQEQEKILLKERANRYTYEGKFANFSFIKKVDRKLVDKKFAMTFADFKKMQMGAKI